MDKEIEWPEGQELTVEALVEAYNKIDGEEDVTIEAE